MRWTDRCPLPVLAVSLTAGLWTACMPLMGFSGWAVPFFGIILDGASGAAVALLGMLLLGVVAYGTYRLRTEAWWLAAGLTVAWGLSGSITFSQVSWMDFYEKMNFPAEQLQLMEQYSLMQTHWMTLLTALWPVAALAYLVYVRRFFTAPESGAESGRLGVGAGHR